MKKLYLVSLGIIYVIYAVAIFAKNNQVTDILSPVLTYVVFCAVLYGFVIKEKNLILKLSGVFYSLSLFSWFLCESAWGISTLILHINPQKNPLIAYGYSATNVFLFVSLLITAYVEIRRMDKIQALLDVLIISICIMVLLRVFVFDKNVGKANMMESDYEFIISMIIDTMIYAWANVWYFSTRTKKPPLFINLSMAGAVIFVVTDFFFYYECFYDHYSPNSLTDGAYMLAFIMMGLSGYIKAKGNTKKEYIKQYENISFQLKGEFVVIGAPIIILIFKRTQIEYFLLLIISILIYYVLINYTQKSIYHEELLRIEKSHVSELEEKVEERTKEIVRIMNTDIITGLYNRRYFEEYLSKSCDFIKKDECINLLYVDINNYKIIKALFGKYVAEMLLKEVGKKMHQIIFSFPDYGLLAAYAEDVFVITLKNKHFYEQALAISKRIINKCSGTYHIESHDIVVTLNIGISCYPADSNGFEEMVKNADSAMMHARSQGYNRIALYNEDIGTEMNNKNKIKMMLKSVNFNEEFKLFFQPQVRCKDGSIVGVEALIRWQSKEGSSIPPSEFIPIAEESGQIIPLSYWVIRQAVIQASLWKKLYHKEFRIAVNISVKQLKEIDFLPRLKDILNKHNISPELFELEITENIQIEYNVEIMKNLKAIRELGISISIDDFGTGYTSLYYLKNLPMDRIKIAKELVDNIENDTYSHAIIQMVIQIAKNKGIKVIAEGVETKEQWECLKVLDCDEIQGYYFGKPVPPDELFDNWIVKKIPVEFIKEK